jgi:Fic family protein
MAKARKYEKTHSWIRFELDLRHLSHRVWMLLGEARSKCEHLAQVPLKPSLAQHLRTVFLAKGVQATTAIEGNTLTEEQVLKRIQRQSPPQNYLEQEVDNVLRAINEVTAQALQAPNLLLTTAEIKPWNRHILEGLSLEKDVVPGRIRQHEVGVGNYPGAPAEDCEWLLERLCNWLNSDAFLPTEEEDQIPMALLRAIVGHLYIAWIHPFGDGNGRTARLLEFRVLVSAGVPDVAAHLLSNHYNTTRREYYARLNEASQSGGNVLPFIEYALRGFVGELKQQLTGVWNQQWLLAWRDYVHEVLGEEDKVSRRRRHLVLDLAERADPVPASELTQISPRVAQDYATISNRTFLRDLDTLLHEGLLRQEEDGYLAHVERILSFRSARVSNNP